MEFTPQLDSSGTLMRCSHRCSGPWHWYPLVLLLLSFLPWPASAELVLTMAERQWLAAHPVIRLGVDPDYAPYSFVGEQGRFQGLAMDFVQRLGALLGVRFEPVPGLDWPQILAAARARRLDVVATAVRLPERESYLDFTHIYLPTPLVVMTRSETPALPGPQALEGREVALVEAYSSSHQALQRYPGIVPLWVPTPLAGLRAVAAGRADAYIGVLGVNTWLARQNGLSNLKVNVGFDLEHNGQRFGVRRDWPELTRLLDKAIAAIPATQRQAILDHWIPVLGTGISRDDLDWLRGLGTLRLGFNRRFPPLVSATPEGQIDGIAGDVMQWLRDRTGLAVRPVALDSRTAILAGLRGGTLDLAVVATLGDQAPPGLQLGSPFHRSNLTLFAPKARPYEGSLAGLRGSRVAVAVGGLAQHWLQRQAGLNLVVVDTPAAALQAVHRGRADVAVIEWTLGTRALERGGFGELRPQAALVGGEIALRLAMPNNRPRLAAILDRQLRELPPALQSQILAHRIGLPEPGLNTRRVLRWAAVAAVLVLLLLGGILLWNHQLNRELERRQQAERSLLAERERTLRVLQQSRDRLAEAQALAHLGNWELDLVANRLWWSEEVYRIFAIEPGQFDVSYEAFLQAVHPEDREAVDRAYRGSVASGKPYTIVHRLLLPDGAIRYVQEQGRSENAADGTPLRSIGTVQDISERETARRELAASEAQARVQGQHLRAVLDSIPDLFFLLAPDGRIVDYRAANESELYLPPEQFVGKRMEEVLPAETAASFQQVMDDLGRDPTPSTLEYSLPMSGGPRYYEARLARIAEQGDIVILVRDISARKQIEMDLREAHDLLEQRVAERTAELAAANSELESFSYAVSHDLRGPLRAIQGFHQALLEDYGESLPDGARDFLAEIATGARRMATLIEGLLTLSRSTRGSLERETIDLGALAGEVHQRLSMEYPGRVVRLETEGPLSTQGDPQLLRSLLENLLDNAWKFTAGTEAAQVRLQALEVGGERVYCIDDNGAGFDPEFASKLFEPFQRLHRQDEFPGIGIGLATVRRIVQRHGGWIRGEARSGGGARFCFTLRPATEGA